MSIRYMSAVWSLDLPSSEKFVLLAIADNANDDDGKCWPSVGTLCKKTGLCERTVQATIKQLEIDGYLVIDRGSGITNKFFVTPAVFAPRSNCTPADIAPTPAIVAPQPPQNLRETPATIAPKPLREPLREPSRNQRERAQAPQPAHRIPENFELTPNRKAVAERDGIPDPERTFEAFRDYWLAASGARARKHDWDATWRTWCRRAADDTRTKSAPRKSRFEELTAHLRKNEHDTSIKF